MNKLLSMIRCNLASVVMFVSRDIAIGTMISACCLIGCVVFSLDPDAPLLVMWCGITLSFSLLLCVMEITSHKQQKYGQIECERFMTPRMQAQVHEIAKTLTSWLFIGLIYYLCFMLGLANYTLSAFTSVGA